MLSLRAFVTLATLRAVVDSSHCPSYDSGECDFESLNPYRCGPSYSCGYENACLATAAGYDISADCCQAPQPSSCLTIFDPHVCLKGCQYDNLCLAELAGYSPEQCTQADPGPCPSMEFPFQCNGEPSDPYKCDSGRQCKYDNICLAQGAGYTISTDCCKDRSAEHAHTSCHTNYAPVSCGPPAGKQCAYDNQCFADAAGYKSDECCAVAPYGNKCESVYAPVECGSIPCVYASQCEATAAGYAEADCCPQTIGACTAHNDPVACGSNSCIYSSESCAALAGFDPSSCTKVDPTAAKQGPATVKDGTRTPRSGAIGKIYVLAGVGSTLLSLAALFA